ncbi:gamma-butyrobetaine hydroxylase-like domain-containing protein [Reinekea marinisedimentorum]|uniref:DUF971 family protein n=1 Tax=Reinekea marinisedimentorum TaxID=230495 RepID=A0A4R3ICR6_9GAMM|nr:DUF971 domain-containing protein [Reinekea marinisedimentorum]TCS43207.1 DUF971 family protein [Reinekea marinisedimentorum]
MDAKPVSIDFNREKQILTIVWSDESTFEYSSEFLRVYSPSAEVRGHGQGQETLQVGKKDVSIKDLKPAGRYALKIVFDDGHDSGIYDWKYLYRIGEKQDFYWQDYLRRLEEAGAKREATFINITQL